MKKTIFALLASFLFVTACYSEASTPPYQRSLAGQVGFEHYECLVAAYGEEAHFKYRVVFRADSGARETFRSRSGSVITRLPILEAEVIRPDKTRHELVSYAETESDGIINLFTRDGSAAYLSLVEPKLTIMDLDGPIKGQGEGPCIKVQPSQARDW